MRKILYMFLASAVAVLLAVPTVPAASWQNGGSYMYTTGGASLGTSGSPQRMLNVRDSVAKSNVFIGSNGGANAQKAVIYAGSGDSLRMGANGRTGHLVIQPDGQIGIGTIDPLDDLDIWDSDDSNTFASLALHGSGSGSNSFIDFYEGSALLMYFCYRGDLNQLGIYSSSHDDPRVVFNRTGNVGIGTTIPDAALDVVGSGANVTIRAAESPGGINAGRVEMGYDSANDYGRIQAWDGALAAAADLILQNSGGKVGIGTTNPISSLDVRANTGGHYAANIFNDGNNANRYGLKIQCGSDNGTGKSYLVDFCDGNGSVVGNITFEAGTVSYNHFTAEHTAMIPEKDNGSGYPYGTVVKLSAAVTDPESPRQPIYRVEPSEKAYDTAVFGIYAGKSEREDNLHSIYAIGDGHILVTREGGEIRTGDYLATSNRRGCAMRQNDDLRHNYTVAKALESVNWEEEEKDIKLIACTYQTQ